MKLFISWSGEVSHRVALHLRDWLPVVLPFVQPWVSSEDIPKGARWAAELAGQLEDTDSGIVCLVPGNVNEPWLNFEAGALSKVVDKARVHPFLVGIDPRDLPGPLTQFQATRFDKADIRKLVNALNAEAGAAALPEERVGRSFDICWPDFEGRFAALMPGKATVVQSDAKKPATTSSEGALTKEDVDMLLGVANADDGLHRDEAGSLFGIHPQKAQHIMERLEQLGLLTAAHNYVYGTRWRLNKRGRAFLASKDLL